MNSEDVPQNMQQCISYRYRKMQVKFVSHSPNFFSTMPSYNITKYNLVN